MDSSFYAGIFVEAGAKPNIVSNIFHGGDSGTLKSSVTQVNKVKEIYKAQCLNLSVKTKKIIH